MGTPIRRIAEIFAACAPVEPKVLALVVETTVSVAAVPSLISATGITTSEIGSNASTWMPVGAQGGSPDTGHTCRLDVMTLPPATTATPVARRIAG